jgi:hypothetical protein
MSDLKKIRPVGEESFNAGRRTDMTKLIVAFRNFAKAPNKTEVLQKWLFFYQEFCSDGIATCLTLVGHPQQNRSCPDNSAGSEM